MSYYSPTIVPPGGDFLTKFKESSSRHFLTGPYHFEMINILSDINKYGPILLYDFPDDIFIYIGDVFISCSNFDYFNPLLMTVDIASNNIFFKSESSVTIERFDCSFIASKSMKFIAKQILKHIVYYPNNYSINYKMLTISRLEKGKSINELIELYLNMLSDTSNQRNILISNRSGESSETDDLQIPPGLMAYTFLF